MLTIGLIAPTAANADTVTMRMSDINPKTVIMPEIYGQFAEHLGSCIYGGLWVGPDSPIPTLRATVTTCSKPCAISKCP